MIDISNILYLLLYCLVIPFILGLLWIRKMKYLNSVAMSVVAGTITMFVVFEVIAVPLILLKQPFHLLLYSWKGVVWLLVIVSSIFNIKTFRQIFKGKLKNIFIKNRTEKFIWMAVFILIVFQIYMPVGHMRTDTDDARFVAEAMEAYELDTMLQYHPITGEFLGEPIGEMQKDVASPFPIFMALMGALLRLPPAIAVHIFFPILFILMAYVVYYLLGNYFLHGNSKYTALFLFFLSLIHCFAYESIYAAGYTLLAVIWQGRSVLAMVIMPLIWLLLMQMMDTDTVQVTDYLFLICSVTAGVMTSSMAIELLPILVGTYALIIGFKKKKLKSALLTFTCVIPCMIGYIIFR